MKRVFLLFLLLLVVLATTGCGNDPDEVIGIRGEVEEIYTNEETLAVVGILVEGEVEEDTMYDSANVTINEDTKIYRGEEEVTVDELEVGIIVEVIFDGPVAESYPAQGTAKKIKIFED